MHTASGDPNEQYVVNYVPDEIAVVVSATGIEDEAAFYEHVRSQLNRQIATLLKASNPYVTDPFEADLAPTVLARRFTNDRAVLQPLRRSVGRPSKSDAYNADEPAALAPWAVFRRPRPARAPATCISDLAAARRWPSASLTSTSARAGSRVSASSPCCSIASP